MIQGESFLALKTVADYYLKIGKTAHIISCFIQIKNKAGKDNNQETLAEANLTLGRFFF